MADKKVCYNRGCGQQFDPAENKDDQCRHHPGLPFFHDAYKGWTCCNKKSVDFTEFLNIKGCELAKHSNERPPEPQKVEKSLDLEPTTSSQAAAAVPEPIKPSTLKRPSFETQLVTIIPEVSPQLKQAIDNILPIIVRGGSTLSEIQKGTVCKNGGCGCSYESPETTSTICVHHPGAPIFHEGLKFWSCCNKKTTDFALFLAQKGCETGQHKWHKTGDESAESYKCRFDWHQTATNVVVAVYAKMYHYKNSYVKVNPIRLAVSLTFPQQNDAQFNLDLELRGIIDVDKTKVDFLGTKVEITLTKAEPSNWVKLDFPRQVSKETGEQQAAAAAAAAADQHTPIPQDDGIDVDLDDIEAVRGIQISEVLEDEGTE